MKSKADWRIVQYKPASEACSKRTMDRWEEERQEKIKRAEIER